ncbi:hypothetical protein [Parabacteroides sp. FAFU027]|uniref:DUF7670 domain-containing protein n=1 Tax=Parabacteroides sp. FAFU027 TaxID=2922715 RepID=UPI001FAFAF44|nr:hypothetical protein [Parabacteroides sp. FAFU027]
MFNRIKIIHWAPRIICILAILFISIFALDAFNPTFTLWQQLSGFFIHLIPSFILLALLILSWKKELLGGILFTLIGCILSPVIYQHNFSMNHSVLMSLGIILIITVPFVVVGVLFIISHFLKKDNPDHL